MAKIFNFVILMSGMLMLLALAGFPTATNQFLSAFGITTSTGNITFGFTIMSVLAIVTIAAVFAASAATGGSIQIGTFVITVTESKLIAVFCGLLMTWGLIDMSSVIALGFATGQNWIGILTLLIMIPSMIAYAIGMIQFWRGNDI